MRCSGGLHKGIILEKIAAKKLSCVKFDSQLQFYANIAVKVILCSIIKIFYFLFFSG